MQIASGDLWAGAEVFVFTLAKTLQKMFGVQVTTILLNHGELERRLRQEGLSVVVIEESRLNGFELLAALYRIIRDIKPGVIHTHRIKENILVSVASLLGGGIPSLRTTHGAPEHPPSITAPLQRFIHFLNWFSGRFVQRKVVSVSHDLAALLEKDFPRAKLCVIENGADVDAIRAAADKGTHAGLAAPGTLRIGIAGRLVPVKCVDLFIRSAHHLLDKHPDLNASFHIFGDGPLRADLEELIDSLNIGHAVHFEGHCDDMPKALRQLDILLVTSRHEGLPMIVLEAMALRTPIIAHSVGGIPAVLDNGACGVLVTDHSEAGYADAIYQLATSPKLCSDLTENAFQRVSTRYSAEQNAAAYLSLYRAICHSTDPAKRDHRDQP